MSQISQAQLPTVKERLAVIETLINAMVESNLKFESSLMDAVKRIEIKQNDIENKLNTHLQEPYTNYKDNKRKLSYEIVKYFLFIVLGIAVAYIGEILGGGQ
jgi:hypothetical protein